jgi:hypothetical protein
MDTPGRPGAVELGTGQVDDEEETAAAATGTPPAQGAQGGSR